MTTNLPIDVQQRLEALKEANTQLAERIRNDAALINATEKKSLLVAYQQACSLRDIAGDVSYGVDGTEQYCRFFNLNNITARHLRTWAERMSQEELEDYINQVESHNAKNKSPIVLSKMHVMELARIPDKKQRKKLFGKVLDGYTGTNLREEVDSLLIVDRVDSSEKGGKVDTQINPIKLLKNSYATASKLDKLFTALLDADLPEWMRDTETSDTAETAWTTFKAQLGTLASRVKSLKEVVAAVEELQAKSAKKSKTDSDEDVKAASGADKKISSIVNKSVKKKKKKPKPAAVAPEPAAPIKKKKKKKKPVTAS